VQTLLFSLNQTDISRLNINGALLMQLVMLVIESRTVLPIRMRPSIYESRRRCTMGMGKQADE
jgi:hypothetical protein